VRVALKCGVDGGVCVAKVNGAIGGSGVDFEKAMCAIGGCKLDGGVDAAVADY